MKTDAKTFNDRQIRENAERIHALQVVALGTAKAPTLERVEQSLRECIAASKEYLGDKFFGGAGMVVEIDRMASPWPTITVYVTATSNFYVRDDEDD